MPTSKTATTPAHQTPWNAGEGSLLSTVVVPVDDGVAEGLGYVGVELAQVVARRTVVADGEVGRNIAANVAKTVRAVAFAGAVDGSAADRGGALPDDLGEVTIAVEHSIGHVARGGLAVEGVEVHHLGVVELLGDDGRDVVLVGTGRDVLAVVGVAGSAAMG